ncbi:MAG: hypothetical protein WB760_19620 [Xanthobacteraceae bacterium]
MAHAHEKRRLKWTPDWPVTLAGSPAANDNVPARKQSGRSVRIVDWCAVALVLVLAALHSAFRF